MAFADFDPESNAGGFADFDPVKKKPKPKRAPSPLADLTPNQMLQMEVMGAHKQLAPVGEWLKGQAGAIAQGMGEAAVRALPTVRTSQLQPESWMQKTARGAGETAGGLLTQPLSIPGILLGENPLADVGGMATDIYQRWSHPVETIREGGLAGMGLDVAAALGIGAGAARGIRGLRAPKVAPVNPFERPLAGMGKVEGLPEPKVPRVSGKPPTFSEYSRGVRKALKDQGKPTPTTAELRTAYERFKAKAKGEVYRPVPPPPAIPLGNVENAAIAKAAKAKVEPTGLKGEPARGVANANPPVGTMEKIDATRRELGMSMADLKRPENIAGVAAEAKVPLADAIRTLEEQAGFEVPLGAGPSPAAALKGVPRVTLGPPVQAPRGKLTLEKPINVGRDFDLRDMVLQPVGIYDPSGKPIVKGSWDNVGMVITDKGDLLNLGSQAGRLAQAAKQAIHAKSFEGLGRIDRIGELVLSTRRRTGILSPRARRAAMDEAFSGFIDLVERPVNNPVRVAAKNAQTPIGEALRLHDELTESTRQYIIDMRRQRGIKTADDWGITSQGYFPHYFAGDIQMFVDGKFTGAVRTYWDALAKAQEVWSINPKAQIVGKPRSVFFGDPTVRVSSGKYWRMIQKMLAQTGIDSESLRADLRGTVGRRSMKGKFFGAEQRRMGYEGWSRDYLEAMRMHVAQSARTQELSVLNHRLQPVMEALNRFGKPELAAEMQGYLDNLWGTPTRTEKLFGAMIRNIPALRDRVAMPDMAFRGVAQRLTGLGYLFKIRAVPKTALIQVLQPYSTLWPYCSSSEYFGSLRTLLTTKRIGELRAKGVFRGGTKLETTRLTRLRETGSVLNPMDWFEKGSDFNRGMGYEVGYKRAIKQGLSEGQAHDMGLAWAERTEFDNSAFNIQPVLRSPVAKVLGQFKSFMGKNWQNFRNAVAPERPLPVGQRLGRASKYLTAQGVIGGAKAFGIAAEVIPAYKVIMFLKDQLVEAGMDREDADKMARVVYFGVPSLLGQDLSASVAIFESPYGDSWMEKGANFVFGPTIGTALTAGERAARGDWQQALAKVSPSWRTVDVLRQYAEGGLEGQTAPLGRGKEIALTPYEAVMRGLGFQPVKVSEYYEERGRKRPAGLAVPRVTTVPVK